MRQRQLASSPSVSESTQAAFLPDELAGTSTWSDRAVVLADIDVLEVPLVTVGGGIGSFVLVDYLRIAGVATDQIRVLSNSKSPWQTYEYLTRTSQIPRSSRLRSGSSSRPDNIWGFPSFAVAEALRRRSLRPWIQVGLEPVLADFYTPRAGDLIDGMRREAERVSYWDMLVTGQVELVRRRHGGGYFTVVRKAEADGGGLVAFRSQYVHLAPGYAGLRYLPDLQEFRTRYGEFASVVNAYENHEHVYATARRKPCTVLVRGSGIAASRVLQRLMDDREAYCLQTQINHLFRTYVVGSHGRNAWLRRRGGHGFAYQGFNYPKSVWGGQLKSQMRKLEGADRAKLYADIGGTSTASRRDWQRQQRSGRHQGWYHVHSGTVQWMEPTPDGRIAAMAYGPGGSYELVADFVIDCTGLTADIAESPLLSDLLEHSGASRNLPADRLEMTREHEVAGTQSGSGRIYASGAITLGGYFPGVDTFLGLQISAFEILGALAERGFCAKIGPLRSITQWLKWMRHRSI
jgi:hypothetical protein